MITLLLCIILLTIGVLMIVIAILNTQSSMLPPWPSDCCV